MGGETTGSSSELVVELGLEPNSLSLIQGYSRHPLLWCDGSAISDQVPELGRFSSFRILVLPKLCRLMAGTTYLLEGYMSSLL